MPPLQSTGVAQSFYGAASAWSNQEMVLYGERYDNTSLFCFDAQSQLTAVMRVRAYDGYRNGPYEPDKLPAPVIAFYTPEQAVQFATSTTPKRRSAPRQRGRKASSVRIARPKRRAVCVLRRRGDQSIEGIIIDAAATACADPVQRDATSDVLASRSQRGCRSVRWSPRAEIAVKARWRLKSVGCSIALRTPKPRSMVEPMHL